MRSLLKVICTLGLVGSLFISLPLHAEEPTPFEKGISCSQKYESVNYYSFFKSLYETEPLVKSSWEEIIAERKKNIPSSEENEVDDNNVDVCHLSYPVDVDGNLTQGLWKMFLYIVYNKKGTNETIEQAIAITLNGKGEMTSGGQPKPPSAVVALDYCRDGNACRTIVSQSKTFPIARLNTLVNSKRRSPDKPLRLVSLDTNEEGAETSEYVGFIGCKPEGDSKVLENFDAVRDQEPFIKTIWTRLVQKRKADKLAEIPYTIKKVKKTKTVRTFNGYVFDEHSQSFVASYINKTVECFEEEKTKELPENFKPEQVYNCVSKHANPEAAESPENIRHLYIDHQYLNQPLESELRTFKFRGLYADLRYKWEPQIRGEEPKLKLEVPLMRFCLNDASCKPILDHYNGFQATTGHAKYLKPQLIYR